MKKLICLIALVGMIFSMPSIAQSSAKLKKYNKKVTTKADRIKKGDKRNLSPNEKAKKQTDKLANELNLDKKQYQSILRINTLTNQKLQILRAQKGENTSNTVKNSRATKTKYSKKRGERGEKSTGVKAIKNQKEQQIQSVLNDTQRLKYRALMKKKRSKLNVKKNNRMNVKQYNQNMKTNRTKRLPPITPQNKQ